LFLDPKSAYDTTDTNNLNRAKVNPKLGVPVNALGLVTIVQMLLGLINLGSTSAFTAFVSVGVQALALAYAIPIAISLLNKREQVLKARWTLGQIIGPIVNVIALLWIAFELVLFSMPTALPVTSISMNYASVVLVGFGAIAAAWYAIHSRKCKFLCMYLLKWMYAYESIAYHGPPASEGL
jgi:hypothetical protein